MTKSYFNFLFLLTSSIILIIQGCSGTQKGILTTKTATVNNGYSVINPGESILIYKYNHTGHSAKDVDKYATKYYFSTASSDNLKDLTKENIKNAYPANHPFHDALDANFTKDEELIVYDDFHKIFKLNRLLQNSNMSVSEKSHSDPMNHDNMKMDNNLMASMKGSMDKMHAMKMSGDFDHDFAHMMIMHHMSGIEMSELQIAKGRDDKLKSLATFMIASQKKEIDQLQSFINNYKVPEIKMNDMSKHHELGEGMKTMMDKMKNMKMTGNQDQDFIKMMIPHHECAITMAEDELTHGKQTDLKKIAENIITDQKSEIANMKVLLSNLN